MELTPEQLEAIRREEFVRGYVAACAEWTSGQIAAVSLAHRAYDRLKRP
jgi:hypothetical protein